MNMPINQVDPSTTPARIASVGEHSVEVRLDPQRAANWLVCLEELLPHCNSLELELLHGELSDACWLAHWKREETLLKLDLLVLPALASTLLSDLAISSCRARIIEDIIATFSRCRVSP